MDTVEKFVEDFGVLVKDIQSSVSTDAKHLLSQDSLTERLSLNTDACLRGMEIHSSVFDDEARHLLSRAEDLEGRACGLFIDSEGRYSSAYFVVKRAENAQGALRVWTTERDSFGPLGSAVLHKETNCVLYFG